MPGFFYFYALMKRDEFRILFMGTPEFAVDSLKAIIDAGYQVIAVVTAPDKPAGRGKKITQSAVKKYALEKGLKVLQPVKLKEENFIKELKTLQPQLGVVVAFRMLPEIVWNLPPNGTINLHASLLPQYRGAAPINHAIMNGEKETGLTTFFLDKAIDTGKIILQKRLSIGDNVYLDSLHDRMKTAGAELLVETIDLIRQGKAMETPQKALTTNNKALQPAPKIFKDDCLIPWEKPLHTVYNHIRALSPFPAPFTYLISPEGEKIMVKIYRVTPEKSGHTLQAGTPVTDGKKLLKVAVQDGFIRIFELQAAGRKRMPIDAFLRGFSIGDGYMMR